MDFDGAADELYGVPPGAFTGARDRLAAEARTAGDRDLARRIGALRRPTLPAWAVNLLSRQARDELDGLLEVGAALREAWASGGDIGGLEQRRGPLVAALVRRAGELAAGAGQPLREPAAREVEDTLQAATVDPDVAAEVAAGRLTKPRSHSGFVPTGFPVSMRRPAPEPAAPERPQKKAKPGKEAERRAEKAERELAAKEEAVFDARRERKDADAEVARLRRELDRALDRQEGAAKKLETAEARRDRAARAAEDARRRADG